MPGIDGFQIFSLGMHWTVSKMTAEIYHTISRTIRDIVNQWTRSLVVPRNIRLICKRIVSFVKAMLKL